MNDILLKKVKALISIRVVFITLLLGSFFLLQVGYRSFPYPRATSNLIVALYSLTIIYSFLIDRIKTYFTFAYFQIFMDVAAVNVLIYLTGGIESWFSFIMLLAVISASAVLNRKAGYVIATFSSILYGVMIDLQYYKLLPIKYDPALNEKDFLYNIFVHIAAFYMMAFLSGYLSSRLEKTTIALEQTDSDLKELSLFNKELIESIPSGIFTTDIDGSILIFNKAAEDITGIPRETAVSRKITAIFPFINPPIPPHPNPLPQGERAYKNYPSFKEMEDLQISPPPLMGWGEGEGVIKAFSEQLLEIERIEGVISHPREGSRIINLTISPHMDVTRRRTGFTGIFHDITMLKKMEMDIKHKEKWAAIGELSANIAHEIRNPLASLKGAIEMLREDRAAKEQKERLTEIALKEMERLNEIITDFLMYSTPRAAEFSAFDLNLVLDDTLELLKNTASARKDISIIKDFDMPLFVNADHQKMHQVFLNLGMNAIEAMPDGGELSVSAKRSGNSFEVVFKDTGIGVSQKNLEKIFYPFFTTKDEGTGLGLAIAYRIIEEHKGKIDVI
ncbi:MAG: PAS domain-containing protein, partial [Nitrospirae bacterium]|nr:PAS domain-containing protein [Nitrospirota bacterium]